MAKRRARPVKLGEALDSWVRSADRQGGLSRARAVSLWPEIAGPEIAQHTMGIALRQGLMSVHVDSHVWATELTLLSEELKDRLNAALGEGAVREMRFTVSRKVNDARAVASEEECTRRRYGGERVRPAELTTSEIEAIRKQARTIESPDLRDAAVRAQIRDLEVKKARDAQNAAHETDKGATEPKKPDIR